MLVRSARSRRSASTRRPHVPSQTKRGYAQQSAGAVSKNAGVTVLETTYQQLIDQQIQAYPSQDLFRVTFDKYHWTYSKFRDNANSLARGLAEVPSNPVSNYVTATGLRAEVVVGQVATARIGRRLVPLRPTRTNLLEAELKVANPNYLLWSPKVGSVIQQDDIYQIFPHFELIQGTGTAHVNDKRFPHLKQVLHTAKREIAGLLAHRAILFQNPAIDLLDKVKALQPKEDSAYLVNDDLKLVALSQYNLLNTGNTVGALAKIGDSDVVLTTIPLHTAAGLALGIPLALARRAQLVIASDVFEPKATLEAATSEYCTALIAFPEEWLALISQSGSKPANLKKGVIVQQPGRTISDADAARIKSELGLETLVTTFGTDETSGVFLANGEALPNTQVDVQIGKVVVKGFNVFNGYKNDEAATRNIIKDNWLSTGLTGKVQGSKILVN